MRCGSCPCNTPSTWLTGSLRLCLQVDAFAPQDLDAAVAELGGEVPIKRLLLLLDLARQGQGGDERVPLTRWAAVLSELA